MRRLRLVDRVFPFWRALYGRDRYRWTRRGRHKAWTRRVVREERIRESITKMYANSPMNDAIAGIITRREAMEKMPAPQGEVPPLPEGFERFPQYPIHNEQRLDDWITDPDTRP